MGDKRPQRLVSRTIEVEEQPKKKQKAEEEKAKPLGTRRVVGGKICYQAFELDGTVFHLGYYVRVVPKDKDQECYVAFIKDIWQRADGSMMVTGQRFYECMDIEGGLHVGIGERELLYSLDCVDFPAEHAFFTCSVLFIPRRTPIDMIPKSGEPNAFIVRVVYDSKEKKLINVEDRRYAHNKLLEISRHFQITDEILRAHEMDGAIRPQRREVDEATTGQSLKVDTPGSVRSRPEQQCDKWFDELLEGIQPMFSSVEKSGSNGIDHARDSCSKTANGSQEKCSVISIEMTDAHCKRCMERKTGVIDSIKPGHGERYQLECTACGHTWYASRDEASMLTIDSP